MKNKFSLILITLVIIAAGFLIWSQRSGLPVNQVLPAKPLIFARMDNVKEHIERFMHSEMGKNLAAIDLTDVMARNNLSPREIAEVNHWQKGLMRFWNNPLIKKFLGKELAAGIYQNEDSYKVFVTLRLTLSTRIAEAFGRLSSHWGDNILIRRELYHGYTINHILFKKERLKLAYVCVRDLIVMTSEPSGHLQEIIDVYQHRKPSLADDAAFNLIRSNAYPKGDGLVFVNADVISNLWGGQLPLEYGHGAFPIYGLSYMPGAVSKYKIMVSVDQKRMSSGLRNVFTCPALSNDTLKLVPNTAIAYNWGGCYDFERSWGLAKERLKEKPEIAEGIIKFKRRLEKYFNINIRKDVLPVLGHEIGGYLTDVDMQGNYPFPIPRLLIFVKVQDRPAAERLLQRVLEKSVVQPQTEVYDHVTLHYFTSTIGANMDPGFGFMGDYLLVATSRQLIKMSIDAYNDSLRSIVSDDVIGQLGLGAQDKFHSVTLMKTAELSRRAQDFLGWVDKYLSDRVTMAAAYKQDGKSKKLELDEAIADKSAELLLAEKKLVQLKKDSLSNAAYLDPTQISGAIANLSREEEAIRDQIANYNEQKRDLSKLLDNYALDAQSDKLAMYNMDNVLSPVLKGLESINAQAVTVRYGDKMLETEFLVK